MQWGGQVATGGGGVGRVNYLDVNHLQQLPANTWGVYASMYQIQFSSGSRHRAGRACSLDSNMSFLYFFLALEWSSSWLFFHGHLLVHFCCLFLSIYGEGMKGRMVH